MELLIQDALFNEQITFITLLLAFATGLLTSLTPCVYPMLPITASVVASNAKNKRESFTYSLLYIMGLSATYSLLGMFAALSGSLFGAISSHPFSLVLVALFCFAMAAWMLDFIQIPSLSIQSFQLNKYKRITVFSAGAISGLVMAPCTSPVLGMVLMYVAAKGNLLWGSTLLFAFSLGMSLLLILVGTFSGLINQLPKSGSWLLVSKYLLASLMTIAGTYFIYLSI